MGANPFVFGILAAGLVAQATFYTVDLYAAYPNRAAVDFDTGEIATAIAAWKAKRPAEFDALAGVTKI